MFTIKDALKVIVPHMSGGYHAEKKRKKRKADSGSEVKTELKCADGT